MPFDFRQLYEQAQTAPQQVDPTSRKGILDMLMLQQGADPSATSHDDALQDAMGPGVPATSHDDLLSGPPVQNGRLVGGAPNDPSSVVRPSEMQAPPPPGGQPSSLPPSAPPSMDGRGGAPGASPPGAPPSSPVAPGAGGQPQLDPQAIQQIGSASPQQLQQTMQLMQKIWEEQQMKNRMQMGRP